MPKEVKASIWGLGELSLNVLSTTPIISIPAARRVSSPTVAGKAAPRAIVTPALKFRGAQV